MSFSKTAVDRYFSELIEDFDKENYYTIQQVMEKFNMSYSAVISFAKRHKLPRVTRRREVFYSKPHIDSLKGNGEAIDPLYYTFKEVMEKYGFTKDQVSHYLHTYHIDRFKRGTFTMINRKEFDKTIKERMNGFTSISVLNAKIEKAKDDRTRTEQITPYPDSITIKKLTPLIEHLDAKKSTRSIQYLLTIRLTQHYAKRKNKPTILCYRFNQI